MVQTGLLEAQQQQQQRSNRFHLLFCGCRSKAVIHHIALSEERATLETPPKKIRATSSAVASSDDSSPSPYDTVSSTDDEDRIFIEVPLRRTKMIQARPTSFRLPTREIVPDRNVPAVSFLTIDPLLMSISTDPYNSHDSGDNDTQYHDRRDDDVKGYYYYNNNEVDDDISDVTGFRDYSVISM